MSSEKLKSIYLFNSFSADELDSLSAISKIVSYKKNSLVFYEGELASKLYILIDGIVSINKTDPKGNELLLHRFFPVSMIAEMATFREMGFPATARCETDGDVLEIDYMQFKEKFISDAKLLFEITKSLCTKIKYLEETITSQLTLNSTSRVAKFLYENEKLLSSMKHTQIASMLNIAPETFSRILKKFKSLGIIDEHSKYIKILNKSSLELMF